MPHVELEPIGEQHVAALGALLADEAIQRFTGIPVPVPESYAGEWIGRYVAGRAEGTLEMFAALGDGGAFVGMALAARIDRERGEAELGYLVDPGLRGRGLGAEILRRTTAWGFDDVGLHRAELRIDVINAGSLAVARRCGYVLEGTLRSIYFKPGFPRADVTVWSRLRTDPGV